jgi:hypothetical protein
VKKTVVGVAACLVIAFVGSSLPASATTRGPQSLTVSCDATTVETGVSVTQKTKGNFKIALNSTSGASDPTWISARSSVSGNDLPQQARVAGETASWTSVAVATYTTRFLRRYSDNCNGILPGNGNYDINYTVTFNG